MDKIRERSRQMITKEELEVLISSVETFRIEKTISATNMDTIETYVGLYMMLTDNYCYPSGCLFVIVAKNKDEYDNLSSGWMIDNVDFKENPKRLVAIITTPENIEKVIAPIT